jgi:rSAM/selenodomain-associated transferase 2
MKVAKDITLIIPVYNEGQVLKKSLDYFNDIGRYAELIFVDGGSSDRSIEIIKDCGKVVQCVKGRSLQMNCGTRHATRSIYLFLHADNIISPDVLISVQKHVEEGFVGGCLSQRIDKKGLVYRIIESQGNLRAKLSKVFYGDQAIFVRKDVFSEIGGFPQVPIMEDVLFSKKMRQKGKTRILEDKVIVSARRWEKKGVMNTVLLYSFLNILFYMKVPLNRIKKYYDDLR